MTACPRCGAELTPDAPQGLCPRCLVQASFDSDSVGEPTAIAEQPAEQPAAQPAAYSPVGREIGTEPPTPAALATHFPHLEIQQLLGYGGMGAVYKARQTKLDRPVALKIIRPESAEDPAFAERFNREARMLARLNHPQIVAIHDFGEVTIEDPRGAGGRPSKLYYFLMEYVDGADLRKLMNDGHLRAEQALAVISQICEALQFAHNEGIVHRDIKPENILLDSYGRVKIADFGLAKLALRSDQDYTLTATHQVVGTLRYMSPEQMAGSQAVDHRADIYSLGVVFYEMLTGEVPMGQFEPPSKVASIDDRLDEVVMRSLAREPERRFQQAGEIKSSLDLLSTPSHSTPRGEPHPGVSTVMENQLAGVWRWMTERPAASNTHSSALAAMLTLVTFLLSLAGCLLVLMPWVSVTIPDFGKSYVVLGSERWAGIVAAWLFLCLSLFVVAIPRGHRLALKWNVVKTGLAALALLFAFQFPYSVEMSFVNLRNTPSASAAHSATPGNTFDRIQRNRNTTSAGRRPDTYMGMLTSIDHRLIHTHWFYIVLGLGTATLVSCGLGIRIALNAKPDTGAAGQPTTSPTSNLWPPGGRPSTSQLKPHDPTSGMGSPVHGVHPGDMKIPTAATSKSSGDGHYLLFTLVFFFLIFGFTVLVLLVVG